MAKSSKSLKKVVIQKDSHSNGECTRILNWVRFYSCHWPEVTPATPTTLVLAGIGTNLACQSGVVPDQHKMDELSGLADDVESACGLRLESVSGGNSGSLGWALSTTDVGRVDELRLGEAILLGLDPLTRLPIDGLRQDGFQLIAEVIEMKTKPTRPWGAIAQTAFGPVATDELSFGLDYGALLRAATSPFVTKIVTSA